MIQAQHCVKEAQHDFYREFIISMRILNVGKEVVAC
jgi:hypothetical protein